MITNQAGLDEQDEQGQANVDTGQVNKLLSGSVIILGQNEQKVEGLAFKCGGCGVLTEGEWGRADVWVVGVKAPNGSGWSVQARAQPMLSNRGTSRLCDRCRRMLALSALEHLARETGEVYEQATQVGRRN